MWTSVRNGLAIVAWLPALLFVNEHIVSVGYVHGRSMQPTLNPDTSCGKKDLVLINKYLNPKLERNGVYVVRTPNQRNEVMIKRLVAVEGDIVKTRSPYPKQYQRIPEGYCWVEGDEPFHSRDSNTFGPIPVSLVEGKVTNIVLPFSRFGKVASRATEPNKVMYGQQSYGSKD